MPQAIFIAVIILILSGYLYEKYAGKDFYQRFSPPGRRFDIGGRRLYALIQGERRPGQPLVVMEAGHGDWSKCWLPVYPAAARFARVLVYDRAGSGWSDPGPPPRTPEQMVADLHKLLECSGERAPYLLVGHSMGGALARLFYHHYPGEVAGMVWVDTAPEHLARFLPFWNKALRSFLISLQLGRVLSRLGLVRLLGRRLVLRGYASVRRPEDQSELLAQVCGPRFFDWLYQETAEFARPTNWQNAPNSLGDLPIISLEAQYTPNPPPGYPPRQWRQYLQGWSAAQSELSRLSICLRRVPVHTGHAVMFEDPQAVIQAIQEMIELRHDNPHLTCE